VKYLFSGHIKNILFVNLISVIALLYQMKVFGMGMLLKILKTWL